MTNGSLNTHKMAGNASVDSNRSKWKHQRTFFIRLVILATLNHLITVYNTLYRLYTIDLTLRTSGDIQMNPGPVKFPCKICLKPVAINQRAIQCDLCDFWLHTKCIGVTKEEYIRLQNSSCTWICQSCQSTGSNISTSNTLEDDNPFAALSDSLFEDEETGSNHVISNQTNCINRKEGRIKVLVVNCRSLKSQQKQRLFNILLSTEQPDIVLGTESHLDKSFNNAEVFPAPYEAFRKDRNHNGGGVFIAYRNDLIVTEVESTGNCELCIAKIFLSKQQDLYVASFYRPPSDPVDSITALRQELEKLSEKKSINLVIGGDFNVPHIRWDTNSILDSPQYGQEINTAMLDTMNDLFLTQLVEEPTRGNNILDLIFALNPAQMDKVEVISGISDHHAVTAFFSGKLQVNKKPRRTIYMYKRANKDVLTEEIRKLKDQVVETANNRNAEENWNYFKEGLNNIVEKNVPKKLTSNRISLPFITRHIKRLIRQRKRRYDRAKKSGSECDKEAYRNIQKEITKEINEAHHRYITDLFDKNKGNRRNLWSLIKK